MCHHRFLQLLLTSLIATCALPVQAQSLGRLFFTPEKRAALDRQRQLNLTQARDSGEDSSILTINGVVQRSSGKSTTWINGSAIDESSVLPGTPITQTQRSPSQLGIGNRKLKVGDTINQTTGEQEDLLRGGAISVQSPKRTQAR